MMTKSWSDVALDWLLQDPRYEITFVVLRRWLPHVLRSFLLGASSNDDERSRAVIVVQ